MLHQLFSVSQVMAAPMMTVQLSVNLAVVKNDFLNFYYNIVSDAKRLILSQDDFLCW